MSYKEIIDNVSNIEDLDNTTILKVLEKFSKTIKDFAIEQSGLNNLVNVEFIPSDNNTTYTGDSVDYLGTLKLTLSDNIIVNKPCSVKFNIKGSNTIVVDVDEFNNSLELHLDNSVVTTLDFAESERQKSKTDGAIVHEKQIADVEHINLLYDALSKPTIGGIAYTSGIGDNTNISNIIISSSAKYIRAYFRSNTGVYSVSGVATINLTTMLNENTTYNGNVTLANRYFLYNNGNSSFFCGDISINADKTSLSILCKEQQNSNLWETSSLLKLIRLEEII